MSESHSPARPDSAPDPIPPTPAPASSSAGSPPVEPPPLPQSIPSPVTEVAPWWRRLLFGAPRDIHDRKIFQHISLVAFLAWVGLGADGLSSSAYGPEEAFKALGKHTYLAVALAAATAFTVLVLSLSYSKIIEHFPYGGGGYVTASKLLGPWAGLVSGCALIVDYVLTITVSVAAAGDALFSLFPGGRPAPDAHWWERLQYAQAWKLPFQSALIVFLTFLNLRGVKESVVALMPIFLIFLITHAIIIFGGFLFHAADVVPTAAEVGAGWQSGFAELGLFGMLALFVRAYSLGGGTYTGIEAVSNGLQIMREPRVATAKRTMVYLAVSLAACSGGLLLCYLLYHVQIAADGDRTLNAVLTERFVGELQWGTAPGTWGWWFLLLTLVSEGALLVVAAQAGFLAGPRSMANMAVDSWMPHRFAALSERLTIHNGIVLMGAAGLGALLYTGGDTSRLVIMYSINVFLTFALCQLAMIRFWHNQRARVRNWVRPAGIFIVAFLLCSTILAITVFEKFAEGGWLTLLVTGGLIGLCAAIRRHYRRVGAGVLKLDAQLARVPDLIPEGPHREIDPSKPTAVILVGGYSGLGIHTLLSVVRFLPGHFHNVVFVSVGVLDSGNFKGVEEVDQLKAHLEGFLAKYKVLGEKLGFAADTRYELGLDPVDTGEKLCLETAKQFPRCMFFAGKLLFRTEGPFQRMLHNETANALQRRLQLAGYPVVILPAKVDE